MTINDVHFNADALEIIEELQAQLHANNINLINTIKDTPDNVMIQCPYHNNGAERKPSAGIKKDDGTFHCFSCGTVHTLPEVISHCFGRSSDMVGAFGWNWLLKNFASVAIETRQDIQLDFGRGVVKHEDVCANYIQEDELDSYRYIHPYWAKRGIVDDYIIELFDLGYSIDERMITFPNHDKFGNCLFVAKRSIDTKKFFYPKNVKKHVYGIYQLYKLSKFPDDIYITESMIDTILLWQAGKFSCALNGVGNEIQFAELSDMPNRHFILATDNDEAGLNARKRIRNKVKNKIFTDALIPKDRKDIGECLESEILSLDDTLFTTY